MRLASLLIAVVLALLAAPAALADQWYKTDTHVHSVVSGDATDDIGIIAKAAKDAGYDAIFLTDHSATSNSEIGGVVANHVTLDENDFQNWTSRAFGSPTATTDAEASSPVNTGVKSLHLAATSGASYGEQFRWYKRGPNMRNGDAVVKFSVYPTRIDPGTGLYVSFSYGGDPTITSRPPQGYTNVSGQVEAGRTNVVVYQLGNPRVDSADPNARVATHQLSYTLNQWNTYTINVSQAFRDLIPADDMPMDLNAITQLKMAAGGTGGTADGYFDTYSLDATAPITSGQEFAYRNTHVADFNTPDFTIFPSQEVGYNRHAQRFNFAITDPSQFTLYKTGISSILPTQQTGYPAQLNHPGLPGGVTQQEAIDTDGEGADLMEVAERSDEEGYIKNVMVDTWDSILSKNVTLLGAWSSDMHRVERMGPATYILSPDRSFNALMQNLYEGRTYVAPNDSGGRAIFNLDGSQTPYAARYPTYVSPSQSLANVRFQVSGGVVPGSKLIWTSNGQQIGVENVDGPSFDKVKTVPIGGPFTYVRAEVRDPAGLRVWMSQPIFFRDAPSLLPQGMTYNVTRVTTPTGTGYTKIATLGVTSQSWDTSSRTLALGLTNPSGSLDELRVTSGALAPSTLTVDGTAVSAAASRADYDSATSSSWWYDPAEHVLLVKARQTGGTAAVQATFTDGGDTTSPAAPDGLVAHAHGAERIDLSWNPSAAGDLRGYTVYRDGIAVAIVPAGTTQFTDSSLDAGTRYTYTVDAFDTSENHSGMAASASATTDVVSVLTFTPSADSYVDSTKTTSNFGSTTTLRVDGSPLVRTYMRYDLSGISGTIEKATLRMYANSSSAGHDVHLADNSWSEGTLNWNNAPAPGSVLMGSSNGGPAGTWTTADVTPAVTGNGSITLEMDTDNTSAISYSSSQGPNPPQLVVEVSVPSNDPPVASDRTITTTVDAPAAWTPSVTDPDGDPLTCAIATPAAHGTATVAPDCSTGSYTPAAGYSGPDSFTYHATDALGATSNDATASVTVVAPNHAPAVADGSMSTAEDTQGSWTPSVSDPDGDTTTCAIATQPTHGSASVASDCSSGSYTPAANYNGPDSFTYTATDSHGTASGPATISATVTAVDDAPTAADRSLTTPYATAGSWTPSVADIDGDTLTCSIATQPAHGTAGVASDCSSGSYTPAAGYSGPDSFTYVVTDPSSASSAPATVSATVGAAPNQPPTAGSASLSTNQDTAAAWTPAASDPDGDTVTCAIAGAPAHGTASVASDCSSGSYTPAPGYSGADSFTYQATDSKGATSSPGTVSATVIVPALFSDGFESGTLAAWTTSRGLVVQNTVVSTGSFAARGTSSNGVSYAKKTLGSTYSDVTYRTRFRAQTALPTGSPTIMRLRTAADRAIVGLYMSSTGRLGLRNDVTAVSKASSTSLSLNRWYTLELHAIVNGAASTIEVSVDGVKLTDVSTTATDLGTSPVGMLQVGENASGPSYDFLYDDVTATRPAIGSPKIALSAAPRCTTRSGLRLTGSRRQRVGRTGIVTVGARSRSTCRVSALAVGHTRKGRKRHRVNSRRLHTALPAGRAGKLLLRFRPRDRRRLHGALADGPVYVLVYAEAAHGSRALAQRKILVQP